MDVNKHCLNRLIVDRREDWDCEEKPMKVGMISSQSHQYSKKAVDLHLPWAMTMKGSTSKRSRWVVPPIWKLWPKRVGRFAADQISLHLSMNHCLHMGLKPLVQTVVHGQMQ